MPRGPGKRENYNLDYSRFDYLDKQDDEITITRTPPQQQAQPPEAPEGGPLPDMRDVMRTMPTELQEAFHLMQISRQNGDKEAERRANELALKAVEKGGPEVKQTFLKNLSEQNPQLAEDMGYIPEDLPIDTRIDKLRTQMETGRDEARKQMEALNKQQEMLESLKSPEDIMKFMSQGGMTPEDMQRMFSGDTAFMEEKMKSMMDNAIGEESGGKLEKTAKEADRACKATEVLHSSLMGETPVDEAEARLKNIAAGRDDGYQPPKKEEKKKKPAEPPQPTVKVADYRLQYQKDENGKYSGVELKVSLPGVEDMSSVVLDMSEEHLRLSTVAPAPAYVVNAGPFPVCIDPDNAKAKFSKKKQELSISVPAKTDDR